jgi:membrane-associated phospholipid phosphatase
MKLPLLQSSNKGKYILAGYLIFCLFYCGSAHIHVFPTQRLSFTFVDKMMPFLPDSIWIYNSQFLMVFLALWSCSNTVRRTATYYAMALATIISSLFFVFMPTEFPHQILHEDGVTGLLWKILYLTDTPQNCFPSLHVALAILAANALVILNRYWRVLAPLWATLICISTLTTKQHYLVDILGGIVVALISWLIVKYAFIAEYADENTHK